MPVKWTMRSVSATPGGCLRHVVAALGEIFRSDRRRRPSGAQPDAAGSGVGCGGQVKAGLCAIQAA